MKRAGKLPGLRTNPHLLYNPLSLFPARSATKLEVEELDNGIAGQRVRKSFAETALRVLKLKCLPSIFSPHLSRRVFHSAATADIVMTKPLSKRPILEDYYYRFLMTESSADFIDSVARSYSLESLETLAGYGGRMSRRAAILAIGFLGDFSNNAALGRGLVDRDRGVRLLADHGIRQLWFRIGNSGLETGLNRLVRQNRQHRFASAIDLADDLIDMSAGIAEVWNQRAIASYHLEDFQQAILDCRRTIQLNPYHFLAALGSANGNLERGEVVEALEDYRLALEINPDLDTVRSQINQLERIVEGR